jgi:hypothetical protein
VKAFSWLLLLDLGDYGCKPCPLPILLKKSKNIYLPKAVNFPALDQIIRKSSIKPYGAFSSFG